MSLHNLKFNFNIKQILISSLLCLIITTTKAFAIVDHDHHQDLNQTTPKLETEIEFVENTLNKPLKGVLGENAKVRVGTQMIYGTGDGHDQFNSPLTSVGLQGNITKNNFFLFDVNVAGTFEENVEKVLMDMIIRNDSIKNHKIFVGRMRPAVGVDGSISNYAVPMINRALISRTFSTARDYGVKVDGTHKYVDYSIGIFNGSRNSFSHNPGRPDISTMAIFKPVKSEKYGNFSVGGGISNGRRYYDYNVLSSYAKYSYKKLDLESEYMYANGYNGVTNSPNKAQGFYVMPTYHLTKNTDLLLRYDTIDPNTHAHNKDIQEYTAGINYYLADKRIHLTVNYIYSNTPTNSSNRVLFMTQLRP